MLRLWLRLRRFCARSKPTSASVRTPRTPSARIAFEPLEERFLPSTLPYASWRQQKFRIDDAVVRTISPTAAAATATQTNLSFGALIGLDKAFAATPYRGNGYSVAVIDTGIDYRHKDLGGGWGRRVVAGYDFFNGDADPMDDNGHGTHVAGIIGSSSATYTGVAPNVNLIALKVLGADGSGSFGAVEDALKWVIAHQAKFNIVAINLSLGSGNFTVNPYSFLEDEFQGLRNRGVFLAVAAGNSFYSVNSAPGLDFPAVSPNVVSVGAVWAGNFGAVGWGSGARDNTTAADRIASFSQRSSALSIMAPGAMINSTYLNGRYQLMAGTSMASPVVAGAAVLLHQALDATGRANLANQTQILGLMQSTGVRIIDGDDENDNVVNTRLAFKRLNLSAALSALAAPAAPANRAPVLGAIASQKLAAGASVTIDLSASDPDKNTVTLSARVVGLDAGAAQAFQLKNSLGLNFLGSYYVNAWGKSEKWIGGKGGSYYILLPSGEFRKWTGSLTTTLTAANLVARFDAGYYTDPSRLWNAREVAIPLTASLVGTQLTLRAAAGATGTFQVEVTASDGKLTTTQKFTATIASASNRPPTLTVADTVKADANAAKIMIPVVVSDPDGDPLTVTATPQGGTSTAIELKQTYGLSYAGGYFQNSVGLGEKWLISTDGSQWFCLLPNGELRKYAETREGILAASNLVATLDATYFRDPSLLWNASASSGPKATVSIKDGQVEVTLAEPYRGTLVVEVSVSDGVVTVKKSVTITFG